MSVCGPIRSQAGDLVSPSPRSRRLPALDVLAGIRLPAGARRTARDAPFLREFNSYFDLVVCADEGQWGALHRYMWDPRALRLGDELDESLAADAGTPPLRASG